MIKISRTADDDLVAFESPVALGPVGNLLGYALRRAQLAVFADFAERMAEDDIRPAQYSVLKVLQLNPGLRQAQVSEALGIKRTNFVPLFDTLERRGLAERRKVEGDRRSFALYLTRAGTRLLTVLDEKIAAHEAKFVGRIGLANKDTLLGLLQRIADPSFEE